MKIAKKATEKGEDGEGIFALRSMKLPSETKHRFISLNYDKLASIFNVATGKEAAAIAFEKVKSIAKSHYKEPLREWSVADESSSNVFFSKEGDPTYISVNFQHKLELFTVKTYGIPDALHQELEIALTKKK